MTPFQQLYLGLGASEKTYMDEVFSTYLWEGTGSSKTITNDIDLAGEGGLVWIKNRESSYGHGLFDTVRGVTKQIKSDSNGAESTESSTLTNFLSNGFTVNSDVLVNQSTKDISSWSFRKAKGFFDVVTWDGNGTAGRVISHSLGSVPGLIMIKSTTDATAWFTYHGSLGASSYVMLNENNAAATSQSWFMNDTDPTSTGFSLGSSTNVNGSGRSYVAYVFAGGESTAATARSVEFDGSSDYLSIASTSDFNFGTGDFTIEFWANPDAMGGSNYFLDFRADGSNTGTTNQPLIYFTSSNGTVSYWLNGSARISTNDKAVRGSWAHYAIVRNSGTTTLYMNGLSQGTYSDSTNYPDSPLTIARRQNGGQEFDGKISNLRIVKGTAVYTSSFRPPTEPLTNITNTKLLCCNNSSTTGSTVTPGTITASGSPTASSDSPFDDTAAFKFGENGDEGIIKCGTYIGNSSTSGPEIHLGWEPQFILLKNTDATTSWRLYDSMRGIVTGGDDELVHPNSSGAAYSGNTNEIDLTSTGFKLVMNDDGTNQDGKVYSYMAIRRPDGYVGKPAELGTGVFALATGAGGSTFPGFNSGFPVDFSLARQSPSSDNWYAYNRLRGTKRFKPDTDAGEQNDSSNRFDSNEGWYAAIANTYQSWMWKRHDGFDTTTWIGIGGSNRPLPHSLGKVPEMIWVKRGDESSDWVVYHKGLNGGTNPYNYHLHLNLTNAEDTDNMWGNTALPTSTHFNVGSDALVNANGTHTKYTAMLFASVNGISKVGSYSGSSGTSITTGFQPRFILIKRADSTGDWHVFDSVRGINSSSGSNDARLLLNTDAAQFSNSDYVSVSSTGFTANDYDVASGSSARHIYYAHA